MNAFVGITDFDWFNLLASQPHLEEINFWQPGGNRVFGSLKPGELFLFKLHSPRNFIVGGGFFQYSSLLPVSLAWDTFGAANGAFSLEDMRSRVERYRRVQPLPHEDYSIGCILLAQPFFLEEPFWIPVPSDWKRNIVQGRSYDLQIEPGLSMFKAVNDRLVRSSTDATPQTIVAEPEARYGSPTEVLPRLGQGAFRIVVTDAYERRCAVSGERVLPVLVAAHIRPYARGGNHQPSNGLLLRSDLHTLFDRGYLTISPEYHLEVSRKLQEDYENGKDYYRFHGEAIRLPRAVELRPSQEQLAWHNDTIYRG